MMLLFLVNNTGLLHPVFGKYKDTNVNASFDAGEMCTGETGYVLELAIIGGV